MRVRFQRILLKLLFVSVLQNRAMQAANLDVETISLDLEKMDHFLNREAEKLSRRLAMQK